MAVEHTDLDFCGHNINSTPDPNHCDSPAVDARIERGMMGIAGATHPRARTLTDETRELAKALAACDAGHDLTRGLPDEE